VSEPVLSVVIVADAYETIRKTVRHLRAQTVADRIELVVVAPDGELGLDEGELAELHSHRVVRVGDIRSLSWARAPGIRAAAAPIVALAESHCFPEPEWAERLLAAHADGWAVTGPAVFNANPSTVVSWVNLLLDYGPWLGPTPGGELDDLPGHNSSYRRDLLLAFGERLEKLLEAETIMHAELRAAGHRLYQEPGARAAHLNVTRTASWIGERFQTGRRFASARGYSWPAWRRAAYAAGSPLIPAVRFRRLLRDLARTGTGRELRGYGYLLLAFALGVSACGELVGYVLGSGDSMYALSRIELHKERHLRGAEQAEFANP
jgi:glycosyltransferase involved in cell wall biosynthesis